MEITPDLLMSEGAGCAGCRDVPPKFDLSKIPAEPVEGECYPYTVSCPGGNSRTGKVCFECDPSACEIYWEYFTIVGPIPPEDDIIREGKVSCGCEADPKITDVHMVDVDEFGYCHYTYTITCTLPNGCPYSTQGEFGVRYCFPVAPTEPLCACLGDTFPYHQFEEKGGGCLCIIPLLDGDGYVIDDSQVDYNTTGPYDYTVKCWENDPLMAIGQIIIQEPICDSEGDCYCPEDCSLLV
jgi:hypothetical protein